MSLCDIQKTLTRTTMATEDSPVVVSLSSLEGMYDVFYFNTVYGRRFVEENPPELVGVFRGDLPKRVIRQMMHDANYRRRTQQ